MLPVIDNYREILTSLRPLLDVRAPCEYQRGHLPDAANAPLLDDEERHRVGLCYRTHGQSAAVALGNTLVSGPRKAQRIDAWRTLSERDSCAAIYCFRGGLRSRIAQQWLYDATGNDVPRIAGGYKALRAFVTDETHRICARQSFVLLGGRTGVGKTELLSQLPCAIDLEALANHRGSAFGGLPAGQPSPASFELALGVALMRATRDRPGNVILEHEGRMVGALGLPASLLNAMERAPIVVLIADRNQRVNRIEHDYIDDLLRACAQANEKRHNERNCDVDRDEIFDEFSERLLHSLARIRKRLGHSRYSHCRKLMMDALNEQRGVGSTSRHRTWIEYLLTEYYDPMYDYQLQRNRDRVIIQGEAHTVIEWMTAVTRE